MTGADAGAQVTGARWRGDLMLVVAGLLFGSTFLVVKSGVEDADPVPFLGARYVIATLVLWPIARRRVRRLGSNATLLRDGVLAGIALGAGYVFQTWGLQYTTSARSAFLTYLLVVFVPILSAVFLRRPPTRLMVVGVVLSIIGLTLLTGGGAAGGFGKGEALSLLCALGFAVHLLIVAEVATRHDAFQLTLVQLATVAITCGLGGVFLGGYAMPARSWVAAGFTGVAATAVAFTLMVSAQQLVGPTRAAIILLIEPVSAGILGAVTGEAFGWRGVAGAVLILAAIVIVEVIPLDRRVKLGESA